MTKKLQNPRLNSVLPFGLRALVNFVSPVDFSETGQA
jgi:hypothetical protein